MVCYIRHSPQYRYITNSSLMGVIITCALMIILRWIERIRDGDYSIRFLTRKSVCVQVSNTLCVGTYETKPYHIHTNKHAYIHFLRYLYKLKIYFCILGQRFLHRNNCGDVSKFIKISSSGLFRIYRQQKNFTSKRASYQREKYKQNS